MSQANSLEWLMLDLINQERSSRGIDPLQLELRLNDSSEDYSQLMLEQDFFSHTGPGGSSPGDRMRDAGFVFSGGWAWGENLAWQSERGAPGLADDVANLHASLMNSSGHRANILNPNYEVIGIGIEFGDYKGWDAVMVTQNFARTSAPLQIDTGSQGTPPPPPPGNPGQDLTGTGGRDTLDGSAGDDTITGGSGADQLNGLGGDDVISGDNGKDTLTGGSGNDTLDGKGHDDLLVGDGGNDAISGGGGDDTVWAGSGADTVKGGNGNDELGGGGNDDQLIGGKGEDTLLGWGGDDALDGGKDRDTLDGGSGDDTLTGGWSGDLFVFSDGDDRITDFNADNWAERIDLSDAAGITGWNDLLDNHLFDAGGSAVIVDSVGNSLTLTGVDPGTLDSGDFLF